MKMRLWSGDMYPPYSMCESRRVSLGCIVMEKLISSQKHCEQHLQKNNTYVSPFRPDTTGATSGAENAYTSAPPEFTLGFSGVRVAQSLVFCVMLCRLLFVLLSFLPLYCLSFNLWLLITHLVSSNFSGWKWWKLSITQSRETAGN